MCEVRLVQVEDRDCRSVRAERLRIVVSDGDSERLQQVTQAVTALGHGVILHESTLDEIAAVTRTERADVAIVLVEQTTRALDLIGKIVRQAFCPVIAILRSRDPAFVSEAAKRGVFAYITDGDDPAQLQGSIDIALRRFAEFRDLEGAFGRRAILERAKGILMERHALDEQAAFSMLRDHRPQHELEGHGRGRGRGLRASAPPRQARPGAGSLSASSRRSGVRRRRVPVHSPA